MVSPSFFKNIDSDAVLQVIFGLVAVSHSHYWRVLTVGFVKTVALMPKLKVPPAAREAIG